MSVNAAAVGKISRLMTDSIILLISDWQRSRTCAVPAEARYQFFVGRNGVPRPMLSARPVEVAHDFRPTQHPVCGSFWRDGGQCRSAASRNSERAASQ